MTHTANEVLEFVRENDVKFIKLGFCDLFGNQKNISIMPDELQSAFENGISFDSSAIEGFTEVTHSDLLLFPDPTTLTILPWRPGPGRVVRFYCNLRNPDGSVYSHDSRHILEKVIERCSQMGYACKLGAECEFYLFKTDENGNPTQTTIDYGGYLDIPPLDKGENIRREICLCLDEMGLKPEKSHHKQGPGQNEIDFKFSDPLTCADNLLTFKSVVKAISERNGFYSSFMPKPLMDQCGSGLHVNLSLSKNGLNIFKNQNGEHSKVAESFIAGILQKAAEITLFLNPTINSYERLGNFNAPKYVSWSHQNSSQLVRIPASNVEKVRMELRSPDPSINPYLAFALIMSAGLDGIDENLILPPALNENLYNAPESITANLTALPESLEEAVALAEKSVFIKKIIGEELTAKYIHIKKAEINSFTLGRDKEEFYRERYFKYI
ncbi:glutamine synthetase family protein [Scatolibacter rhodanostii]|uniref:glutamine synthetase family protein n=1 Tax=Scatolibacter rhodanostii TaxID=2014781 RepID=UPI000C08A4DA|nr:glutamine synthetase family protein [Scatolibacter rhodanostii]